MSFVPQNNPTEGVDHRSSFLVYDDGQADQHEEHQSTRSELPLEIPDSQPDPWIPYLPDEIPDSQPDRVYYHNSAFDAQDYLDVLSQLPVRDHSDANEHDSRDNDLREEGDTSPRDSDLDNQENIDPSVNRSDTPRRGGVDKDPPKEACRSSSSANTEIVVGGTRLTERFKSCVPLHKKGIDCNGRLPLEAPQYKGCEAMEEVCTQPVTQPVARNEAQIGMLSEQDESDIICILLPTSPAAHEAVELTALAAPQHILQNHGISHIYKAPDEDVTPGAAGDTRPGDDAHDSEDLNEQPPDPDQSEWDGSAKDIALRFSSKVHNLGLGFTFGRNPARCDLLLSSNDANSISQRHFRVFMMSNGSLMIEDTSTNGTYLDNILLRLGDKANRTGKLSAIQHTLCDGDTIEIPLSKEPRHTIRFSVKMPMRSESGLEKYDQNCAAYIKCVEQAERQYGFLIEARKNGNAPVIHPDPMHALPQGMPPATSAKTNLLTAATDGNVHGMRWSGGRKYNVVGFIGQGAFANVYKISHKSNGLIFAAKQLDKKRCMKDGGLPTKMYNELNVIKSLRHPNIVKYVDHHETAQWLFIVMEYVPFGDLGRWIRVKSPMPEYMCMYMARQILQALDYLHKRGITHRDIKPDNILMASDYPYVFKLSDFGLSKIIDNKDTFLKTFCGTMMYCAPEVYPGYQKYKAGLPFKRSRAKYNQTLPYEHSVDIWGLGAVLYHLLSKDAPFIAEHDPQGEDMLWKLMHEDVNWERLKLVGVSHTGIHFLSRMLVTDPAERASDEELLAHPWIQVAQGPADAPDCVLSDPADRLNAHASQLSLGNEEDAGVEGPAAGSTEDPRASKRTRTWVPDTTRNVWGETASMAVRNQQHENWAEGLQLDLDGGPPPDSVENVGNEPQQHRLFGEIGASALASSGALGLEGTRALQIQGTGPGSYDPSFDPLYDVSQAASLDSASAATESKKNTELASTQTHNQNPQHLPGSAQTGGAPSLLGTEALVGQLNMASIGSGASAQVENGKLATPDLSKAPDSPSSRPNSKRSSQDMLPPETGGASKRLKTAGLEHNSGPPLNTFEGNTSARVASMEDVRHSPMSRPGSRDSDNGGNEEGQQSRGAYKSNYDLPSTAFNSRESSQHPGAEDDTIMGDNGDSDDEVSRLEEALAAAKAKKAAKAASRASPRDVSQISSRPTSSHGDQTFTTQQNVTGSAVFDAAAHLASTATPSFVKPALRFGKLQPTRGSIHTPSIYITERLTTYGRKPDSTFVHPNPREDRIPKQALDIQMWYPGIESDIESGKKNWMNHPKLEAILRTRTSLYVRVNGVKLKKGQGEYLWGRLRTGDEISIVEPKVGATTERDREFLRFRCEFFVGLSKSIRKPGEKAFVVEVEKDKFKVAEERKSRESTASLVGKGASKAGDEKGKSRDVEMTTPPVKDAAAGKS